MKRKSAFFLSITNQRNWPRRAFLKTLTAATASLAMPTIVAAAKYTELLE